MKTMFIIFILTGVFHCQIQAQEKIELFGYFESQYMGTAIKEQFYQLQTNKLRVDLKSQLSEKVSFGANFDYITYHGKIQWDIPEFLPHQISQSVPEPLREIYRLPFNDRNFLDNAFIKIAFQYFDLTVGKQQISTGTGYVWNPTDVFNIKDLFDPTYEQPGHNAARMDLPIGSRYTMTALYAPDENWQNSTKLIRFKGRIARFDYALLGIEKGWRFHNYTQFDFQLQNFTEFPEKRQLIGVSTAGEIVSVGLWAEYGYNQMEVTENFHELVIGGDYTFDFQTYVMVEFYQNSLAKNDYRQYDLNDWMRMLTNEQKSMTRNQLYGFIQHPVTDFITLGTSTIYSVSDQSLSLIPTLNYSLAQNLEVLAYLNFNFGREGTVYSKSTGNGGMLRARLYF